MCLSMLLWNLQSPFFKTTTYHEKLGRISFHSVILFDTSRARSRYKIFLKFSCFSFIFISFFHSLSVFLFAYSNRKYNEFHEKEMQKKNVCCDGMFKSSRGPEFLITNLLVYGNFVLFSYFYTHCVVLFFWLIGWSFTKKECQCRSYGITHTHNSSVSLAHLLYLYHEVSTYVHCSLTSFSFTLSHTLSLPLGPSSLP